MNETLLLKELQKGLIAWYDFEPESSVLYIGDRSDAIADCLISKSCKTYKAEGGLADNGLSVVIAMPEKIREKDFAEKYRGAFDYIVCIELIETVEEPAEYILSLKELAKADAVFLLGMNNRMGIRYFCGDRDKYTNRNFDGIEGYFHAYKSENDIFNGRMYDKAEIKAFLSECNAENVKFYSIVSDLRNPVIMYADGYKPKEDLATRIYPVYNSPETIFLEEETLYKSLVDNDMFHQMANAYLVEFSFDKEKKLSDAVQITSSTVRDAQNAMLTIVHGKENVEKRNLYPEGRPALRAMLEYADDLRKHGLKVVDMELTDSGLIMPYIEAPVGQLHLKNLFLNDIDKFYEEMDHFRDLIIKSSEAISGNSDDELGVTLKYGYPDLVPLNSFYIDGDFVFFDQEFRMEKYPANAIVARMVLTFYAGNFSLQGILTRDELAERYGLRERLADWRRMEWRFLSELRNDSGLR